MPSTPLLVAAIAMAIAAGCSKSDEPPEEPLAKEFRPKTPAKPAQPPLDPKPAVIDAGAMGLDATLAAPDAATAQSTTPALKFSVARKEDDPVTERVQARLKKHLTRCQNVAGKTGRIYLELSVSATGKVSSAQPPGDEPMTACIRSAANEIGRVSGVSKATTIWLAVTVRKTRSAGSRP